VIDYADDDAGNRMRRNLGPVTTPEDSSPTSTGELFEIVNLFSKGDGSNLINSHRLIQSGSKCKSHFLPHFILQNRFCSGEGKRVCRDEKEKRGVSESAYLASKVFCRIGIWIGAPAVADAHAALLPKGCRVL